MRTLAAVLLVLGIGALVRADNWPQFRGPRGRALADRDQPLPADIGPDKNVLWKVALPPGHSSPIVWGERIFLTAVRDRKLFTLGLDRKTGQVLWEKEAPYKHLEKIHSIGSYAQATPATDGQRVVSYFGSSGLWCYGMDGKLLWHVPMGPFKNDLGGGSSPILAGDHVILNQDHDLDSFLICLDKNTGKTIWKTDRSEFPVGYATPVLWEVNGHKQVVVAGTLRVAGYDFETGKELWTVRGMARAVHMTPTVTPEGTLYAAGWTAGGDDNDRIEAVAFAPALDKYDKNKNGLLENDELPEGPIKQRFGLIDRDKDQHITKDEWEFMRRIFDSAMNRMMAIKPGGLGDIGQSHLLWSQRKYLPVVPSPLVYRGQVFLMRNGGLLATLDAATGKLIQMERVTGISDYYASPVGGDGKVYLLSERGYLTVISAEGTWKVLAKARFDEDVYATPAIADGRIYLRTREHLYCFGLKP